MAFEALERILLQAGQMRVGGSVLDFELVAEVEKLIVTKDLRLKGCVAV